MKKNVENTQELTEEEANRIKEACKVSKEKQAQLASFKRENTMEPKNAAEQGVENLVNKIKHLEEENEKMKALICRLIDQLKRAKSEPEK